MVIRVASEERRFPVGRRCLIAEPERDYLVLAEAEAQGCCEHNFRC